MITRFTHPRLPDWPARWSEFVKDCLDLTADLKLDWEYIHCAQFSGSGIEAITGHDPYEPFKGKFKTAHGGMKVIKEEGFNTLDDLIAALFEEVPLSLAQSGDIALARTISWEGDEEARTIMPHGVVLCDPPVYYAVTPEGFGKGNLYEDSIRAFAVGRSI